MEICSGSTSLSWLVLHCMMLSFQGGRGPGSMMNALTSCVDLLEKGVDLVKKWWQFQNEKSTY